MVPDGKDARAYTYPQYPASGERGGQSPLLARLDRFRTLVPEPLRGLAIGSAYRANSAKEGETLNALMGP